ncbi:hypothetical protein [Stenotrophomonas rhizophila]|uniref:hypothetical protein n=1 Tax=Stenotrophomonas rhizophila TaxID=216778 RepID=UPI0011A675E0|nr:hypothetical protein [Stenotrophomonas rhizophila]
MAASRQKQTSALTSKSLPNHKPPGSILLNVEWSFVKAVHIGETITATVEVLSVREDKPICQLRTTVRNQRGEACLHGTTMSYTVALDP